MVKRKEKDKMAKFCTKCGKKLEEGKACECETKEVKEKTIVTNNTMVNDYLEVLKGMFTKPLDTMKDYAKRSKFNLGLIMLLLNAIIFGLFIFLFAKEGMNGVYTMIYGKSSLFGNVTKNVEIPIKIFFISTLMMVVYHFLLGGFIHFISTTILKKESDLKKTYSLIGCAATITTATTLLALIFIYVNIWLCLIVLSLGSLFYLINLFHGFSELTKVDKNKMAYTFTSAYAVTLFIVCYVLPKIFS